MSEANKETKNVLMTTLSTLNGTERLNYYFCRTPNSDGTSTSRLLSGKFSSEIGSKYLLSTVKIDKIVVVGSKETYNSSKETINASQGTSKVYAYDFYIDQIRSFLNPESVAGQTSSQNTLGMFTEQIGKQRINDLKTIVDTVLKEFQNISDCEGKDLQEVLRTSADPDKTFKKLEKKLKAAIEKDINGTHDLSAFENSYKERIQQLNEEYADVININIDTLYKEERKKITDDTSLSSLDKHLLYLLLKEKIEHILTKQENYRSRVISEENLLNLLFEKSELEKELEMIKSNRLNKETDYAKYLVYILLENEYKFFPLKENKEGDGPLVVFVDESTLNGEDNLHEITNAICETDEPVNLYIDMQGGNRTSGYVRNAVLSILTNQINAPVFIQKIIATNYAFANWLNEIVDETKRYKILDLVSGMNAFIRYGKADIIKNYCDTVSIPKDSPFRKLVDLMIGIDHALCLCDVNTLYRHISELRKHFSDYSNDSTDEFSNIYQVLRGGIETDYGPLIKNEQIEYIDLIDWSVKKGFTQQALTLIEDKMPSVFFERKWLTHPTEEDLTDEQKQFLKDIGPHYKIKDDNIFLYYLPGKKSTTDEDNLDKRFSLWSFLDSITANVSRETVPSRIGFSWLQRKLNTKNYVFKFQSANEVYQITNNSKDELLKCVADISDAAFIFLYCKICALIRWSDKWDNNDSLLNLLGRKNTSELLFYILKKENDESNSDFSRKNPVVFFSPILDCVGEYEYKVRYDDNNKCTFKIELHDAFASACYNKCNIMDCCLNLRRAGFSFTAPTPCTSISEDCRLRMLDEFFLLHQALKNERNYNNHAAEQEERLSKDIIDKAIKIYVERFRKLQSIIDSENSKGTPS